MPRVNPMRRLVNEANLARRIGYERVRAGQSYAGLAKRLEDAGYPIQPSAIFKIEKGDPPRRITVDELVGFSQVFDIPLAELLLPPEVVADQAMQGALTELAEARMAFDQAKFVLEQTEERVARELARLGVDLGDTVVALIGSLPEQITSADWEIEPPQWKSDAARDALHPKPARNEGIQNG